MKEVKIFKGDDYSDEHYGFDQKRFEDDLAKLLNEGWEIQGVSHSRSAWLSIWVILVRIQ